MSSGASRNLSGGGATGDRGCGILQKNRGSLVDFGKLNAKGWLFILPTGIVCYPLPLQLNIKQSIDLSDICLFFNSQNKDQ